MIKKSVLSLLVLILSLWAFVSCDQFSDSSDTVSVPPATPPIAVPDIITTIPTSFPCHATNGVPPREFTCEGKKYVLYLGSCNIFCKKELANDWQACQSDPSRETRDCWYENIGRHLSGVR